MGGQGADGVRRRVAGTRDTNRHRAGRGSAAACSTWSSGCGDDGVMLWPGSEPPGTGFAGLIVPPGAPVSARDLTPEGTRPLEREAPAAVACAVTAGAACLGVAARGRPLGSTRRGRRGRGRGLGAVVDVVPHARDLQPAVTLTEKLTSGRVCVSRHESCRASQCEDFLRRCTHGSSAADLPCGDAALARGAGQETWPACGPG